MRGANLELLNVAGETPLMVSFQHLVSSSIVILTFFVFFM